MKKTLVGVVLALLLAVSASAQTPLNAVLLQDPLPANTSGPATFRLSSASGIAASTVLYVDREALIVTAVSGSSVTAVRGYLGTSPAAHAVGATVYSGAVSSFATADQTIGATCTGASVTPSIYPASGRIFSCVDGAWAEVTGRVPSSPVLASGVIVSKRLISGTAPSIASGFGTSPSVTANNGSAAFTVNVGTGGTASSGVVTMPAATTGWSCAVVNRTAVAANRANQWTVQTASTATSVTVQNQTISTGAALAWTASDVLVLSCLGY